MGKRSRQADRSQSPVPSAPPPRRVFRLTYTLNPPRQELRQFRCRDGIAFCELNSRLAPPDYAYEGPVILYPQDRRGLHEGYPEFRPSDLLVLTTRPPLDDHPSIGVRKHIVRNGGALEVEILERVCRKYFEYCDRRYVKLTGAARDLLRPQADPLRWWDLEFFENHQTTLRLDGPGLKPKRLHWAAVIKKHQRTRGEVELPPADRISTVAYLLRDRLPTLGCEVLVSFGMDGDCTLIWNHLVRSQHPEWIQRRGFVMAELVFTGAPARDEKPPITLDFADRIVQMNVLADAGPLP